jgi:hypothetical protein
MSPLARRLTQKDRVLRALRTTRGRGVTAVDFLAPAVIDSGAPITRVAARIEELRKDGHNIQLAGRRDECVIYVLAPPAEPWQPIPDDTVAEPVTELFDTTVGKPDPASPYDDPDRDWAA